MTSHLEARLGSLVSAGGIVWAVHVVTKDFTNFNLSTMLLPSGPLELAAVGILIWLHAKWRGSVTVR